MINCTQQAEYFIALPQFFHKLIVPQLSSKKLKSTPKIITKYSYPWIISCFPQMKPEASSQVTVQPFFFSVDLEYCPINYF